MRVLVTGGGGQVATAISHVFPAFWKVVFPSRALLDITNPEAIKAAIIDFMPDVIVNTAAFTAVDEAEKFPERAFSVNTEAVAMLARICSVKNIPFIHFSTDYVFDGLQSFAYTESDQVNPINIYGLSKLRSEVFIREICKKHIILRVSSVFSPYKNNFVKTILRLAKKEEVLRIVSDQVHCPTSAFSIAVVVKKILENLSDKTWGTYHYCQLSSTSWYSFAKEIIRLASEYKTLKTKVIQPITANEFNAFAVRPGYSVLNCKKIENDFGVVQTHWCDDLKEVVRELALDEKNF
jgi:dTDP-4-dehydrorhamnose reductase